MKARSASEIWEAALGELQIQVSKPNYRTWLEKTAGLEYQNDKFVVSVPNVFVAEYLDKNQRSLIEKTLIGLASSPGINVSFQVDGKCKDFSDPHSTDGKISPAAQGPYSFKPNYVFESFVVGKSNHLAYSAARGVAQNQGGTYNPLFIYGGVGLGKTHLLHAIGHAAMANNSKVICVSAEQFTNEFVAAVQQRKTEAFRNKYRNADMLLVDDIYFINGKEQTEGSFFHIFNELHNANRQIVITSDQPPRSMKFFEERLRSRFEWGLVVNIQPPDFETRLAILQSKAAGRAIDITLDVLEFIARRTQQNIRELEGYLNRVVAYAKLLKASPDIELATQALEDITGKEPETTFITPHLIIKAVADSFSLASVDLTGSKRDKETTLARRMAMYLLRQETNCSVAQIGQELGGRDPSAVTNACKKISADANSSSYLRRKISETQKRINIQTKAG